MPGVILEVAYTQKKADPAKLAHVYIVELNGATHAVVGIAIEYPRKRNQSKRTTLEVWRPEFVTNTQGQKELVACQTTSKQVAVFSILFLFLALFLLSRNKTRIYITLLLFKSPLLTNLS